jgi:hypothetical protein
MLLYFRIEFLAALMALCGCMPMGTGRPDSKYRTVHVRVAADPGFASHLFWKDNVRSLFAAVNTQYHSWIEVEFVVDTIVVFNAETLSTCQGVFEDDCLRASLPKGSSDLVVYLTRSSQFYEWYAGLSVLTIKM